MYKFVRALLLIVLMSIVVIKCADEVYAEDYCGVPVLEETELPENLNLTISYECSEHENFLQAAAREDGCFAVYTLYTDMEENPNLVYKLAYVDLYAPDGTFLLELSFYRTQELAMELTDSAINLYFYDMIISYDLMSGEIVCYRTEQGAAKEYGAFSKLRQAKFSAGEWVYTCKRAFHGYTKLSRTNGCEQQELLSYSGTGVTVWNTVIPAILIAVVGVLLLHKFHKRAK